MQRVPDPYQVLGLVPEATMAEVRAAHRRLAKRFHPDAPHADAARFLAVQDAYELLRDPLRRREWDRQHLPGPVRAAATTAARRRRGSANVDPPAASTGPASRGRRGPASPDPTFGPNDRPPQADTWTWTAEGVPWWEDGGGPRSRRSGRRRPPGATGQRPATGDADASQRSEAGGAAGSGQRNDPPVRRRKTAAPADPTTAEGRSEFDVFSRSSGAAWSSASRAYFRRRAADMPSGAASPNTPRWTTPVGAPPPRRYQASPASSPSERAPEPEPEVEVEPEARPKATSAPPTAMPTSGSAAAAAPQPTSPAPRGGSPASSRRLGAALAALIRRGHR